MNDFIVCAYYTEGTLYEDHARVLQNSLMRHKVPYHIKQVPDLGSWALNTSYKPVFLAEMLGTHEDDCVVYVDVDAEFIRYPTWFDSFEGNVAAYRFPWTEYRAWDVRKELLSGTLFLRSCKSVRWMVDRWAGLCEASPNIWDQKHLETALLGVEGFAELPPEYCKIFDKMEWCTDPVIVHYQASRGVRRHRGRLTH